MGFVVPSSRARYLNNVAAVGVLAVIGVGCSSDFSRFDVEQFRNNSTTNQVASQQNNPYPGEVDPVTTASISRANPNQPPVPGANVAPPQRLNPYPVASQNSYPNPNRNYVNQNRAPSYTPPRYQQQPQPRYTYNNSNPGIDPIVSGSIEPAKQEIKRAPKKVVQKVDSQITSSVAKQRQSAETVVSKNRFVSVNKTNRLPQYSETANRVKKEAEVIQTASRTPVTPVTPIRTQQAPKNVSGWTAIGGSTIVLREGETLYNVSKRYGVPVSELKKANNITNEDQIVAGQRIVVPIYIYSADAPVSAPDNDPRIRSSRSDRGVITHVADDKVIVPTRSPKRYESGLARIELPSKQVTQPVTQSGYVVSSGDTLSRIASKHNTSVSELMRVNNLENSNIRLGQKLKIPSGQQSRLVADASQKPVVGLAPIKTDRVVTGAIDKDSTKTVKPVTTAKLEQEEKAPARSGIETFRWPATGRVLHKFGERRRGERNEGIDISVPVGTSVKAAENGLVIYADSELQEYGNLLLIRHDGGWVSAYAHNSSLKVRRGDKVRRGQIIAKSGRTGNADRPMIHFELRKDSNPVDPQRYLR